MDTENFSGIPDALPDFNIEAEPDENQTGFRYEESTLPSLKLNFEQKNDELPSLPPRSELEPLPILTVDEKPLKEEGPLFVRTDKYKVIISCLDTISDYVIRGPEVIYMLKNHKKNADIEHRNYAKILEDIQRKLIYVDSVLFNEGVK